MNEPAQSADLEQHRFDLGRSRPTGVYRDVLEREIALERQPLAGRGVRCAHHHQRRVLE
jgi:hypothetical protein